MADLVVMTPAAVAFVSGPAMVAAFTGVRVDLESLGGVGVHSGLSGLCALESDDTDDAVAELLSYLPRHADEEADARPHRRPPRPPCSRTCERWYPTAGTPHTTCATWFEGIADDGVLCELWGRWAPQLVTGFLRLGGRSVGVVANQPRSLAGTLDIQASQKGARFVRLCDGFNLPILTLVDTPGFLPGKDLEWRGMIRHGAELAFAYAEATVPRLCVILRKAFGGAYIVMDSRGLGNDLCVAWPGAEVAVMGAPGAVQILHRKADIDDRRRLEDAYSEEYLTPWPASERGLRRRGHRPRRHPGGPDPSPGRSGEQARDPRGTKARQRTPVSAKFGPREQASSGVSQNRNDSEIDSSTCSGMMQLCRVARSIPSCSSPVTAPGYSIPRA